MKIDNESNFYDMITLSHTLAVNERNKIIFISQLNVMTVLRKHEVCNEMRTIFNLQRKRQHAARKNATL